MSDDDPIPIIIERVAQPVERDSKSGKPGRGVDLGPHQAALRRLLSEAHEIYEVALDDWETRADADKPKRRLKDNWPVDEPESPHDYGEDVGAGLEDWEGWRRHHYHRRRGNPGRGRTRDLPVEPLHAVYRLVRRWWLKHIGRGFNPTYKIDPRADADAVRSAPRDMGYYNPTGRLLLLVAQEMNLRYTARICYGVHETLRKKRQRAPRSK